MKMQFQIRKPTLFLIKTYQLVDDPTNNDVISWNDNGSTFIIWQPSDFSKDLLPKLFKHNNLSSFIRQLNNYGFRRIIPKRLEFTNDSFKRGEKHLLSEIHRHKNLPPFLLKNADIVAENHMLREKNTYLNQKLSQMKNMGNNILMTTTNHAMPLDLMPIKSTESTNKGTPLLLTLKVKEKTGHEAKVLKQQRVSEEQEQQDSSPE